MNAARPRRSLVALAVGLTLVCGGPLAAERVVVVELFTSQGCSSCPPADRLLRRLGAEGRVGEAALVPLAFHVDYWNRLGWEDPFSARRWSARQHRYAEAFGNHSVYTPQVVIDGTRELVGSDERRLRAELAAAAAAAPGTARIALSPPSFDPAGREVALELTASGAPGAELVAMVALFESGLVTEVRSGENARRSLANDYVVRLLRPAATLAAGEIEPRSEHLVLGLDPGWETVNLGVAAFLQEPDSLAIRAAAVARRIVRRCPR